ncbi:VOC family protein [Streptomyces sp. NPDC050548]|uniref:VOC family protein n=1 Tax=Streptomyces sp. NPDC050548 TaxID=3365629 RepID=UPI0037A245D5
MPGGFTHRVSVWNHQARSSQDYTTVAPWIVTDDTGAFLDFATQAFGGEELGRVATEDGLIGHEEIHVGETVVPAFDRYADRPAMPSLLRVFVADADRTSSRAVEAGGRARVARETLDAELSGRPDGRSSAPPRATDWPNRVRQTA